MYINSSIQKHSYIIFAGFYSSVHDVVDNRHSFCAVNFRDWSRGGFELGSLPSLNVVLY